jgi:uncharacterized membrane protein
MSTSFSRLSKIGSIVGHLALVVALVTANRSPASGYELSMYRSTPTLVWAGLGIALAAGVVVGLTSPRDTRRHDSALLLVGSATFAVVAMPILRGYSFLGGGDSLSHVGWAREISAGVLSPDQLLYPGIHTATVFVGEAAGISLLAANLYVVLVAFPLVFLLCVPLIVQLLGRTPRAYAVGLLGAGLFVPINNISVHFNAHAASQGILYSAIIFYLALLYVIRDPGGEESMQKRKRSWIPHPGQISGIGILLAGASLALLFIHPQQALNLGLCFVAITGAQAVLRYFGDDMAVHHRLLHVQTTVLVVAFALWAPRFERVQGAIFSTVTSIFSTGATTEGVVAQKSTSLTTVGGSLPELFIKLFLVAAVFSLLAGLILTLVPFRDLPDPESNTLIMYLGAGLVPVFGVFLVVLASASGDMYFRYQGFIMVPVTALGATALAYAIDGQRSGRRQTVDSMRRTGHRRVVDGGWGVDSDRITSATVIVIVLLLVLLPVGLAVFHSSPYVYQPNKQVTGAQVNGYASAFEYRQPGIQFAAIRGGPERYVDLHYGTDHARETLNFPGYKDPIPTSVFAAGNYTEHYQDGRYVATTRGDRIEEVGLYDGLRYDEPGFRALDATPGMNRVLSNDELQIHYVPPEGDGDLDEDAPPGETGPDLPAASGSSPRIESGAGEIVAPRVPGGG